MQSRQHDLSDWLTLHGLDAASCRFILDAMKGDGASEVSAPDPDSGHERLDLEVAWSRVSQAMREFLPEQQSLIDDTFARTEKVVFSPRGDSRKAATIDNGPGTYPTILYSYRGDPTDFLVLAHEFGHALQIRASGGKFIPPIMREVCAFIGESALLSHSKKNEAAEFPALEKLWRRDNAKYFGVQRDRLSAALAKPQAPYKYSWNYPVARYLAVRMREEGSRDQIWRLFEGECSVLGLLEELGAWPGDADKGSVQDAPSA